MIRTQLHHLLDGAAAASPDAPALSYKGETVGYGELLDAVPDGGVGLAVSHGAAIRDAVPALVGWPTGERTVLRGLDNCAWVVLDALEPGPLRLTAYNRVVTG